MSIPPIPSLVQPTYHAWVRPIAHASFWLSLLLTVYFVMQGLLLWPLRNLPIWHLVEREVQDQHLHSLTWLGASGGRVDDCRAAVPGLDAGQLGPAARAQLGPVELVVILLLSALANFAIAGWLDVFMRDVIRFSPTTPSCSRNSI
jgi:hypothetical protein